MEGKNGLLSLTLSSRGGEGNPQSQFCQTQVQKEKRPPMEARERRQNGPLTPALSLREREDVATAVHGHNACFQKEKRLPMNGGKNGLLSLALERIWLRRDSGAVMSGYLKRYAG